MKCEYIDSTHTYLLDGKPLPSVTTILQAAGLYDSKYFTEEARNRGKFIHKAILYLLQDDLSDNGIPDEYRGYIDAFRRFMAEADCEPYLEMCEVPLFSETLRYGGTPDIICLLNGKETILDVKTGSETPVTGVQLSGYTLICPIPISQRCGLYLKPTGKYKLVQYSDRNDFNIFNAALSLYHWRQKEGLL